MKRFLTLFLLFLTFNAFAEEAVLKYGVLPSNPNSRESLAVFTKYLSEKIGKPTELVYADTEELLSKLADGDISFGELSSTAYATAMASFKDKIKYVVTVAARNEEGKPVPYYRGLFLTLKDSPYNSPLDLNGKSFGFVSRTSTSGYVYPMETLKGMGIDPETFFGTVAFAGNHAKIFEGLKTGFLDAGVSNYDALDKAKAMYGNIFKIIATTAEIPSGAIVASSKVDEKTVVKAQDALISLKPTDAVVNYPGFLYKGFIKKGVGFYDFIKGLIKKFF